MKNIVFLLTASLITMLFVMSGATNASARPHHHRMHHHRVHHYHHHAIHHNMRHRR